MLLEELAKKNKLNVDFHNHGQTGSEFKKKPKNFKEWFKNLLFEEGFSNLKELLDRVMNTNIDVLYITNFSDSRYEDWTSQEEVEIAKQGGYKIEQGDYYTFARKGNKTIALGKSEEVPTTQGHVLFAGLKRDKKFSERKSLDETLEEVDDDELKISDHPYLKMRGQNGVIAYSKNPEKDAKKFDALERNANLSPFPFRFSLANYRAQRYSAKYKKQLIVGQDGHHPKDVGKTYNIFNSESLDYNSERAFRDSINYSVREGKFDTKFKPIPIWRFFHHILMILFYKIRDRRYNIEKK